MNIEQKNIDEIIPHNMLEYSAYVLLHRAIPDLRDGLKPVQRRILWAMYYYKDFKFTKSANVTGQVMRLHPHGSSYDTIVNMTQKDRNNTPFIIGKGNFGQKTSKEIQYAADRYTEVKISDLALDMISDYKKGATRMIPNYDNTLLLPEVFPVKFPTILTHENSGVGVGYSSSIPSFNLSEIANALIKYMEDGTQEILYPDFATGGCIVENPVNAQRLNFDGSGSLVLRGKAHINKNEVVITEIPFTTTREAIVTKITELYKAGKLKEITDIHDLTGLNGLNITITAKRGTDMDILMARIYQLTPLQTSYGANMNVLDEGLPVKLGVWQILLKWLVFRQNTIKMILDSDIKNKEEELHLLHGLKTASNDIDKVIEIVRFSDYGDINTKLMKHFSIDEEQAKYVAGLSLRNMNVTYIKNKVNEIIKLDNELEILKNNAKDTNYINSKIAKDLIKSVELHGKPRKTEIIEEVAKVNTKAILEATTEDYQAFIYVTAEGYIYKFKENQKKDELQLKPKDKVKEVITASNKGYLMLFDDVGNCFKALINDIPLTRKGTIGTFYKAIYTKYTPDKIIAISALDDSKKYLIIGYENNRIAKIDIQGAFNNSRIILKNAYNTKVKPYSFITLENDVNLIVTNDKGKHEINTSTMKEMSKKDATGNYVGLSRSLKGLRVK